MIMTRIGNERADQSLVICPFGYYANKPYSQSLGTASDNDSRFCVGCSLRIDTLPGECIMQLVA